MNGYKHFVYYDAEDIWVLDVTSEKWCPTLNSEAGSRLWHTAAVAHPGEVTFYGGIKNNLLDHTKPKVCYVLVYVTKLKFFTSLT